MAKVPVYNMEGSAVGEIELKDEIFGVDINEHLVHMAVVSRCRAGRATCRTAPH